MSDPRPSEADVQDVKLTFPMMRHLGFFKDNTEPPGEDQPETHVATAEGILRHHGTTNDPHGFALAHAVLALVEQQRIANLIAFEQITGEKNRAEIRKGLRL